MSLKKFLLASGACLLVGVAHVSTAVSAPPECPRPKPYQGGCIQVITYAKNPQTGTCCEYATPCAAPEGWQTYGSLSECQGTGPTVE